MPTMKSKIEKHLNLGQTVSYRCEPMGDGTTLRGWFRLTTVCGWQFVGANAMEILARPFGDALPPGL